ncbi:MAG: proteinase inhibitor [Deltaproteobacteria bacterium]|nr:proteinase inhibitor [Deltaproteobacteria bacterium]
MSQPRLFPSIAMVTSAALLLTACEAEDGATVASNVEQDAGGTAADATGGAADGSGAADTSEPALPEPVGACRYTNPFGGTNECKAYTGPEWDASAAQSDCAAPMPGTKGAFSAGGCDEAPALGDCLVSPAEGKGYVLRSLGDNPDTCALAKTGCEVFAKGSFNPASVCGGEGGGGGGGGGGSANPAGAVFVQPYVDCRDPLPGEPAGKGDGSVENAGKVCTNVLISGATEPGRDYADYASCDAIRTQRPYWPADPIATTAADDPRLQDAAYMAEVDWATEQLRATACVCCHAGKDTPNGASNWDIDGPGIWLDHVGNAGLAMMLGKADSTALGAYPAAQNHGFDRTALGLPTTDIERMRKLLEGEWKRRGLTDAFAAAVPAFGGPLVAQLDYEPGPCADGEGVDADGKVRWSGGKARYVYVLDAGSANPGVPPNLDEPAGTRWLVDVPTKASPFASGLAYGAAGGALRQRIPAEGAPAALVSGASYALYVLADIGVPLTRCVFKAP